MARKVGEIVTSQWYGRERLPLCGCRRVVALEAEPEIVLHAFALRGETYEATAQIRERGVVSMRLGDCS